MMVDRLRIAVTGQMQRQEFAAVMTDILHEEIVEEEFTSLGAIFLLQSYPGEFSQTHVESLRAVAPLTPIIVVLGSWCGGEQRTGTPLTGVFRVTHSEWRITARRELEHLRAGRRSLWSLPPTTGDDELPLIAARDFTDIRNTDNLVRIAIGEVPAWGVDKAMTLMLTEFFREPPFQLVQQNTDADWIIIDVASLDRRHLACLCERDARVPVRVCLLVHDPREDEIVSLLANGAAAVIPKPLDLFALAQKLLIK